MRHILITIPLTIFFACGPDQAKIDQLNRNSEAKKEREAKTYLDKSIAYFKDKKFYSAKYTLKQTIDYYASTSSALMAKQYIDSVASVEKSFYADPKTYKIVKTDHHPACQNFHVLLKFNDNSKKRLTDFTNKFIAEYCGEKCMIMMYSSDVVSDLMTKYPLSKSEYKKLAKYTIASWDWETKQVYLNPYKDAFN